MSEEIAGSFYCPMCGAPTWVETGVGWWCTKPYNKCILGKKQRKPRAKKTKPQENQIDYSI